MQLGIEKHHSSAATAAFQRYTHQRQQVWKENAALDNRFTRWSNPYHQRLQQIYQATVLPGQRVLEIGCGTGDLLAAVAPAVGIGVDFSPAMLAKAARNHPDLLFIQADAHSLPLHTPFDVIILSDVVNDLWDVHVVFEQLSAVVGPHTRIVLNTYSRLWELPLGLVRKLGLARHVPGQSHIIPRAA